jgi:hypothetical protein
MNTELFILALAITALAVADVRFPRSCTPCFVRRASASLRRVWHNRRHHTVYCMFIFRDGSETPFALLACEHCGCIRIEDNPNYVRALRYQVMASRASRGEK